MIPTGPAGDGSAAVVTAASTGTWAVRWSRDFLRFDRDGHILHYLAPTGHLSRELMKLAEERIAATRDAVGPDMDIIIETMP